MATLTDLTPDEAARVEAAVRRERALYEEVVRRGERPAPFDEGNCRGRAVELIQRERQQRAAGEQQHRERERQGAEVRAAWASLVAQLGRIADKLRADIELRAAVAPESLVVAVADVGPNLLDEWARFAASGEAPAYRVAEGALPDPRSERHPWTITLLPRAPGEALVEIRYPDPAGIRLLNVRGYSRAGRRFPDADGEVVAALFRAGLGRPRPGAPVDARCTVHKGVDGRGTPILEIGGAFTVRDAWSV